MTLEEALEAGMLAEARAAVLETIEELEGEISGDLAEGATRWPDARISCASGSAADGEWEGNGRVVLPPAIARTALEAARAVIEARLHELGVDLP